jgi:hypothetical protein
MADATSTTISRPAPYLEAAGQTYLDLLTKKTGQAPTAAELQAMSPQIAGQNVLITTSTTTSCNTSRTWCINI